MAEIVTVKDFNKEYEKAQRKKKVEKLIHDVEEWCKNNPEHATILLGGGVTVTGILTKGITNIVRELIRSKNLKKEELLRELMIWDPSEHHRWQLKRKLTSDEWLEISERRANGEKLADILDKMKVLR